MLPRRAFVVGVLLSVAIGNAAWWGLRIYRWNGPAAATFGIVLGAAIGYFVGRSYRKG
jgi:hypothetical protein